MKELSDLCSFIRQQTFLAPPQVETVRQIGIFAYLTGIIFKVLFLLYNIALQKKTQASYPGI